MARIIRIGLGEVISNWGTSNGKPAVIIEPANKPGPVGHRGPGSNDDPLHEDAVVLEIHAPEGLEVLVDDMRKALEAKGIHVPASIMGL